MSTSFFDYLFIFYCFIFLIDAKSLICHRFECASQDVDWVCGSDGQNYPNLCELERIKCFGVAVQMHNRGKCRGPSIKPQEKRRIGSDGISKKREECTTKAWQRFVRSLGKFWRKDYFRKPRPGADVSLSIEKRVLHYNFDRIDTNHDDQLTSAEWKFYRTNYQQYPIRSRCSRDLLLHCDQDLDRLISRIEWMQCLYTVSSKSNSQWYYQKGRIALSDAVPKKNVKSRKHFSSITRQKPALLIDKKPCQNLPKLSGNSSLDKYVYGTDCQIVPVNPLNANCSADKNLKFLQMLFSQFKTEMIYIGKMPTGGMKTSRRQAATWKFEYFDKNGDKLLQPSEWRSFRLFIKEWDGVKKCARSFFRGCDSNFDRRIDVLEWNACTVDAYEHATITPQHDRNPFLYLLKPEN